MQHMLSALAPRGLPSRLLSLLMLAALAALLLHEPARAADPADGPVGEGSESSGEGDKVGSGIKGSGLPVPRFVSLRTKEVNMRIGPGVQYPVEWVYHRRELPVEVIAEFEVWRKIRDPEGAEGWVHQSMLAGKRTVTIRKDKARVMLRRTDSDASTPIAWLSPGVIGKVLKCPRNSVYCQVEIEGYHGWLSRDEVWGVYRAETID